MSFPIQNPKSKILGLSPVVGSDDLMSDGFGNPNAVTGGASDSSGVPGALSCGIKTLV